MIECIDFGDKCSEIAKRSQWELVFARARASVHTQHMPHIMLVNRIEANKECFRPDGFDQFRPHSIRSLQFNQKVRPLSFRPEKFELFTATPYRGAIYTRC